MRARLLATMDVTDSDFRNLAGQRAALIQDYLVNTAKIEAARISLASPEKPPAPSATPRVVFAFK
jgi:hypothetical protein